MENKLYTMTYMYMYTRSIVNVTKTDLMCSFFETHVYMYMLTAFIILIQKGTK